MEAPRIEYLVWEQANWPPAPRWRLAAAMWLLTLVTTTVAGARMAFNFSRGAAAFQSDADLMPVSWAWHHPGLLAAGLPFSLALMAILLAHEMGHYLACRHYRIDATLPYFLPAPTLVGTLGAFIRIRSPFRNRREVFDVGVAGPLAGMVVALPVLAVGLWQSGVAVGLAPAALEFGCPPLQRWLSGLFHASVAPAAVLLSPLARAGWLGLFVTMLNLLPAAQLDGGHLLYAWLPRAHRVVSWTLAALLVWAGWHYWPGWYIWAAFIAVMHARHPGVPSDGQGMGAVRGSLTLVTVVIFAAVFLPAPFITP